MFFRDFGLGWLQANRGHVSHAQLKVMSAIEACGTAALGGYVALCENTECGLPSLRTVVVAIATAPSVREVRPSPGWRNAWPSCCRFPTFTSSEHPVQEGARRIVGAAHGVHGQEN